MRTKLKKDEKIMLLTKKHWLPTLFNPIVFLSLFILLGLKVDLLRNYFLFMYLTAIGLLLYKILDRAFNTWAVTNQRVIEETGILTRITTECPLDKINNVSYSQNIWGRMFGFGTVIIQTAAQHGVTIYSSVNNPQLLKETLTTMQEEYKKSAWREQTEVLATLFTNENRSDNNLSISSELEKLFELKEKGVLTESEYTSLKYRIFNRNTELS
jgi:uncharacterized membrane protein YdbT with pleckstrin-like domain